MSKPLPLRLCRWTGSKARLIPMIMPLYQEALSALPKPDLFVSPFLGSGALELALLQGPLRGVQAILSDANESLIAAWTSVGGPDATFGNVVDIMRLFETEDRADPVQAFQRIRSLKEEDMCTEHMAARFFYLNQTAFHGLWRTDRKGQFNAPREDTRKLFSADKVVDQVRHVRLFLKSQGSRVQFHFGEIEELAMDHIAHRILNKTMGRVWAYLDPPYVPASSTRGFTSYQAGGFQEEDQHTVRSLAGACGFAVVSNSDTEKTRQIYKGWCKEVPISIVHSVGPQARSRTPAKELALAFRRD